MKIIKVERCFCVDKNNDITLKCIYAEFCRGGVIECCHSERESYKLDDGDGTIPADCPLEDHFVDVNKKVEGA